MRKSAAAWSSATSRSSGGASTVEVNSMLFSAADKGCIDLVKLLLSEGASLEARDRLGARPLARAASAGEIEIVRLFLDKAAPIDARDLDGSSALFKAAEAGRFPNKSIVYKIYPVFLVQISVKVMAFNYSRNQQLDIFSAVL